MTAMISDFSPRAHGKGKRSARSADECTTGQVRDIFALPRPAQTDRPTAAVLMPLFDVLRAHQVWVVAAFLLGTIARDAFGNPYAVGRALQSALDLAEPEQVLFPFLGHPSPGPADRPARRHSADAALVSETADVLARADRPAAPPAQKTRGRDFLTHGETRVLHYLPTNLSAQEIARELFLSVNTVKTHQRHLYQKLGARSRTQAVERARALGLLRPSSHGR